MSETLRTVEQTTKKWTLGSLLLAGGLSLVSGTAASLVLNFITFPASVAWGGSYMMGGGSRKVVA